MCSLLHKVIKPRLLRKAGMGKIVVGYPSPYHKTMPLTSILKLHCLLNPYPVPKPNPNPNPCPVPTHAFATPSSLLILYTLPETNHLARFGFAYYSIPPSTNHLIRFFHIPSSPKSRFFRNPSSLPPSQFACSQHNFSPPLPLVTNFSRPPRDVS
jgi:hypothetical protein